MNKTSKTNPSSWQIFSGLAMTFVLVSCSYAGLQVREPDAPHPSVKSAVADGAVQYDSADSVFYEDDSNSEYEWTFDLPEKGSLCSPPVGFFPAGAVPGAPLTLICGDQGEQLIVTGSMENPTVIYVNPNDPNARTEVRGCLRIRDAQGNISVTPTERGACRSDELSSNGSMPIPVSSSVVNDSNIVFDGRNSQPGSLSSSADESDLEYRWEFVVNGGAIDQIANGGGYLPHGSSVNGSSFLDDEGNLFFVDGNIENPSLTFPNGFEGSIRSCLFVRDPATDRVSSLGSCLTDTIAAGPGNPVLSGFLIGGSSSGLPSGQVVKISLNNKAQELNISENGNFRFPNRLLDGEAYVLSVSDQPADAYCMIAGSRGRIQGKSVNDVRVVCSQVLSCPQNLLAGIADGSSSENAAPSCHFIKVAYPQSTDGIYWLDADGQNSGYAPFQIYCDMSQDGGGWTLINKSEFSSQGPSKVELTGDPSVTASFDPWSGGKMPCNNSACWDTEYSEFTNPIDQPGFPYGYNGEALLSSQNDLEVLAPQELYAVLNRSLINLLRSQCYQSSGKFYASGNEGSVMRQQQHSTGAVAFVRSSKRFNPIQHKCKNNLASTVCSANDVSGCAEDMILGNEIFDQYVASSHQTMAQRPFNYWTDSCSYAAANGVDRDDFVLPTGWMGGYSLDDNGTPAYIWDDSPNGDATAFYDLTLTGALTSGPISGDAGSPTVGVPTQRPDEKAACQIGLCNYTTVWVK